MEPKEVMELREALEQDTKEKLLPRILWERGKPRPRSPNMESIRESDFFDLEARPDFDLVIGNPPWVSRKSVPSAEAWLFSPRQNPAANGLKKSEQNQTLFPARELACAFMWKAGLHVRNAGRVCQLLPSRVFLSNNTDSFQAAWLQRHRLESVWLLADYRFVLFPGAICPCFVGRYHPRRDGEPLGTFQFITPKVEVLDPREAMILVQPEDQKVLEERDIIAAAGRAEAASAWKQQHWGTPRDVRLIERLSKMPRLRQLVSEPPKDSPPKVTETGQRRPWWKGQGFKPFHQASYERNPERYGEPKSRWWDNAYAYLPARASVAGLVLCHA
jgi:hypothetical protein